MLTLADRNVGDVLVLDLSGQIAGGPESQKIYEWVKEKLELKHRKLLLNLEEVVWVNSMGVGVLISSYVSTKRRDGELKLCYLADRIDAVLRIHGLIPTVFQVFEDEAEAVRSFS